MPPVPENVAPWVPENVHTPGRGSAIDKSKTPQEAPQVSSIPEGAVVSEAEIAASLFGATPRQSDGADSFAPPPRQAASGLPPRENTAASDLLPREDTIASNLLPREDTAVNNALPSNAPPPPMPGGDQAAIHAEPPPTPPTMLGMGATTPRAAGTPRAEPKGAPPTQGEGAKGIAGFKEEEPNTSSYLGVEDEFDAPAEMTPMAACAKAKTAREQERRLPPLSEDKASEAPTTVISQEQRSTLDTTFMETPEFEEWMKTLSMGQRMRVQERVAIRNALAAAENGIRAISDGADPDSDTWEAAAQWQLPTVTESDQVPYLSSFGYKLADKRSWKEPPVVGQQGIKLEINVDGHVFRAGHTWYKVVCKLHRGSKDGFETMQWVAPRRLVQLRIDLHHRVKAALGVAYEEHFRTSRFAKYGGPPGTTARLEAWFASLATVINSGIAPPIVATTALVFLQAPTTNDVQAPVSGLMLRKHGDEHSNLGDNESSMGSNLGAGAVGAVGRPGSSGEGHLGGG